MSWTHFSDTKPKARKDYRCYLCGLPILKGEEHLVRRGVSEGQLVACRMHEACENLTRQWDEDDWIYHDESEFRSELLETKTDRKP